MAWTHRLQLADISALFSAAICSDYQPVRDAQECHDPTDDAANVAGSQQVNSAEQARAAQAQEWRDQAFLRLRLVSIQGRPRRDSVDVGLCRT